MFKMRMRLIALVILALILSVAVYGFAAANTVPTTTAGEGANVISGYTVTDLEYTLDWAYPSKITKVSFNIFEAAAPAVADIAVGLSTAAGSPTWDDGCVSATFEYECSFSTGGGFSTLSAERLIIIAGDNIKFP